MGRRNAIEIEPCHQRVGFKRRCRARSPPLGELPASPHREQEWRTPSTAARDNAEPGRISILRVIFLQRVLHWLAHTRRLGVRCCIATTAARHYLNDNSHHLNERPHVRHRFDTGSRPVRDRRPRTARGERRAPAASQGLKSGAQLRASTQGLNSGPQLRASSQASNAAPGSFGA